jgi:hypothetical protein
MWSPNIGKSANQRGLKILHAERDGTSANLLTDSNRARVAAASAFFSWADKAAASPSSARGSSGESLRFCVNTATPKRGTSGASADSACSSFNSSWLGRTDASQRRPARVRNARNPGRHARCVRRFSRRRRVPAAPAPHLIFRTASAQRWCWWDPASSSRSSLMTHAREPGCPASCRHRTGSRRSDHTPVGLWGYC